MRFMVVLLALASCLGMPDRAGLGTGYSSYDAMADPSGHSIHGEGQNIQAWVSWQIGPYPEDQIADELRRGFAVMAGRPIPAPVIHHDVIVPQSPAPRSNGSWLWRFDAMGIASKVAAVLVILSLLWICRKQVRGFAAKWLPSVLKGKKRKGK